MSKQDSSLSYKELKKVRPKLEDTIPIKLGGEAKQAALDFVGYCKDNRITYPWGTSDMWYLTVKGKHIGTLRVGEIQTGNKKTDENTWYIHLNLGDILPYMSLVEKEDLKEIIWKHIKRCERCSTICRPGKTMMILGKELKNVCVGGFIVRFYDPDTEQIKYIKELMNVILKAPIGIPSRPLFDPGTSGLTRIDNKSLVCGVPDPSDAPHEQAERLFDGVYSQLFHIQPKSQRYNDGRDCEIFFQLDKPDRLSMYSLVTSKITHIPNKWALYGAVSGNGVWEQLDTRMSGDAFPGPVTRYTEKAFKINSPGIYQYYRLTLEGSYYSLSQVHLYIEK